jgi:hypothetical protein
MGKVPNTKAKHVRRVAEAICGPAAIHERGPSMPLATMTEPGS